MGRAISNKNVLTAKFEVADFDGAFLASFGRPELRGAWIITVAAFQVKPPL